MHKIKLKINMKENKDLELLEQDETKLYNYLISLSKSEKGISNVSLFEKYLHHESEDIRSAAIFSLLFVLKIDNELYRNEAIKYVKDKFADFDLRQWSISGLAQTYLNKKDLELLRLFFNLLTDDSEDEDLKPTLFRGMLNVYGVNSRDIIIRSGSIIIVSDEVLSKFAKEMNEIKRIISQEIDS